jgi:hypothetical protein
VNPGSTVQFTPSSVEANRFADGCGGVDPSYSAADSFSLQAIGTTGAGSPYTSLVFEPTPSVVVGTPYSMQVQAYSDTGTTPGQGATSGDGALTFSFSWGADTAEIDASPLSTVTLTVVAFPTQDGEPMTVHCVLGFTDGKTLDMTFSRDIVSDLSGCAAG